MGEHERVSMERAGPAHACGRRARPPLSVRRRAVRRGPRARPGVRHGVWIADPRGRCRLGDGIDKDLPQSRRRARPSAPPTTITSRPPTPWSISAAAFRTPSTSSSPSSYWNTWATGRALELLAAHAAAGVKLILSVPNSRAFDEVEKFHVTNFGFDEAMAAFDSLRGREVLYQYIAEGSLIQGEDPDGLEAELVLREHAEPDTPITSSPA